MSANSIEATDVLREPLEHEVTVYWFNRDERPYDSGYYDQPYQPSHEETVQSRLLRFKLGSSDYPKFILRSLDSMFCDGSKTDDNMVPRS
jgi:hypothetical protein